MDMTAIKEDLKNGMGVFECCEKYGLSFKDIVEHSVQANKKRMGAENRNISRKSSNINRYIACKRGRPILQKHFKGKPRWVLTGFTSIEDARIVRDELVDCEWDISQVDDILKRNNITLLPKNTRIAKPTTYLRKTELGKYIVHKQVKQENGSFKNIYYGTYDTLEEAQTIRDELIKHNWDKTQLKHIKEKVGINTTKGGWL